MKNAFILIIIILLTVLGCMPTKENKNMSAADILGNSGYQAICYGGYRQKSRDVQPTLEEIKEDLKILQALNIKVLRTYNVHLAQAANLLKAISRMKEQDADFEMYVMLGAWIDCKNAWTNQPRNHNEESEQNAEEIKKAVALVNQYSDIVKIIAVGNEAMVHWAESYYVHPKIILKWVNYLQDLKQQKKLPQEIWITSSDDFASWGGGDTSYHIPELNELIKAVDYISMHTYPMHNTYYHPEFWYQKEEEQDESKVEKIDAAMERALNFTQKQYQAVKDYMNALGVDKPVHIGETGWATVSDGHYGAKQSRAADEYKSALYYKLMRQWTNENNISCFYFEAFDEPWKDSQNAKGSENHFGLLSVDGKAKYAIWNKVDGNILGGLTRNGNLITKTYNGKKDSLMKTVLPPPKKEEFEGFQN